MTEKDKAGKLEEVIDKTKLLAWSDNDLMFQEIQEFWQYLVINSFCPNIKQQKEIASKLTRHKIKSEECRQSINTKNRVAKEEE